MHCSFGNSITSATSSWNSNYFRKISIVKKHDTRHLENVLDLTNTSRDVHLDKGYADGERDARLKAGWRLDIP